MRKILIIMIAVLTAAAFVGCTSAKGGLEAANAENTKLPFNQLDINPNPIDPNSLERPDSASLGIDPMYLPDFSEVVRTSGGSEVGAYYVVLTDADELKKLTGDLTGKAENAYDETVFQRDFVVAVFVTVATGGYTVELDKAYNTGNTVTVKVKVTPPAAGAAVTQALETRCVLVAFDRGDFYDDLSYEITVNDAPVESGFAEA